MTHLNGDPIQERTNLSLVLIKEKTVQVKHRPIPTVGALDVLVEVVVNGICGSDVRSLCVHWLGRFELFDYMQYHSYAHGGVSTLPFLVISAKTHELTGSNGRNQRAFRTGTRGRRHCRRKGRSGKTPADWR